MQQGAVARDLLVELIARKHKCGRHCACQEIVQELGLGFAVLQARNRHIEDKISNLQLEEQLEQCQANLSTMIAEWKLGFNKTANNKKE